MISVPPGSPFGRPFRTSRALFSGSLTLLALFVCSPSLFLPLLFEFPSVFLIFQSPDTPKSLKIKEKPTFFNGFANLTFSCFSPTWQPCGSHFRSRMDARASRLGFLGALWQLSGELLCFLGTTFGHSSSLRALFGCLLEPNCVSKPSNTIPKTFFGPKILKFLQIVF